MVYDYGALPGAEQYDGGKPGGAWERDMAEKARRNWLRWRDMIHPTCEVPHFALALRLVALVQPSSAFVERCFSQLKLIVDACGHNMLADALVLRMFLRCNERAYTEGGLVW